MPQKLEVKEGFLKHRLPYFALGSGKPLVVLRGFTPTHANPTGLQRKVEVRMLTPLAQVFRVYSVNRPPGLSRGASMEDIAGLHAEALLSEFEVAVDVLGMSSGGSVALQLAADRHDIVRRLILASAGYRLGSVVKEAEMRYVAANGAERRGAHHLARLKVGSSIGARVIGPLMWLLDPLTRPKDPSDMAAFARAEIEFDIGQRLGEIIAPTLVIAGDRDKMYSREIFRRTAEGVRDGRLILYPGASPGECLPDVGLLVTSSTLLDRLRPLEEIPGPRVRADTRGGRFSRACLAPPMGKLQDQAF